MGKNRKKIAAERLPSETAPAVRQRPSTADTIAAGKDLRDRVPRNTHATWKRPTDRADPLSLLRASDVGRRKELLPIRYGRMVQSPFSFFRGAAAVMAADLAKTPSTAIRVQACGDCHLMNFGGFATPERNILFDMNDFDETLPAPWEWDLKRLATSFVLAARNNGLSDSDGRDAAIACARSYREHVREYAWMSPLEVWYARIGSDDIVSLLPEKETKSRVRQRIAKAREKGGSEFDYPELAGMVCGQIRIRDFPPLIFHPEVKSAEEFHAVLEGVLAEYRNTLAEDRRVLLDRYEIVDAAIKVVGIGSVGTNCAIVLMMSIENIPLFLQWKEARSSVLEPYAGKSAYSHHGQRVVMGQRLMQPASDIFLGWATSPRVRVGYVRQLRDAKIKPLVETFDAGLMAIFGTACGWSLARAHSKAGDPAMIGGYLGSSDRFDVAIGDFALAYADQTERDHAVLKAAVRAGKIAVYME